MQKIINLFKANITDFRFEHEYDIIFSSGVFHFVSEPHRKEICDNLKAHTLPGGFNVLNVFDCNSGGTPHKHCMDTLIAQKINDGERL